MYASLVRLMTGPEAHNGDTPERRSGYVALSDVLTIIHEQSERLEHAIQDLKATFRDESVATRHLVDTVRSDFEIRIKALETWRNEEEVEEAVRRGRMAMFLLAFHWLTEHWQVVWALVFLLTTIFWRISGGPTVGVGPVQQ